MLELPKMSIRLRAVSEFHCSYGYNATHSGSHRFIPRMNIEVSGSCHIGVAQQARYRCDVDAVFDSACRKRVSHGVKFDMFQVQLPQNPRKVMAEVVRVHHTAATIKNDKIFVTGFPTELFCKALPLQLQQLLYHVWHI